MKKTLGKMGTGALGKDMELESASSCASCGEDYFKNIRGFRVRTLCSCEEKERDQRERRELEREKQIRLDRLRSYSMMDRNFFKCRFENFQIDDSNREAFRLSRNYCDNWEEMKKNNIGFLFYGRPGVGKSYLSFCIANELLDRLVPVIAISSIGIINRIYDSYGRQGGLGENQLLTSLEGADLLIIDDLGAEYGKEKTKQIIYSIIDKRSRMEMPTIVTTNLDGARLAKKLGQDDRVARIEDRLLEICYPIEIRGRSRREKNIQAKEKIIGRLLEDQTKDHRC